MLGPIHVTSILNKNADDVQTQFLACGSTKIHFSYAVLLHEFHIALVQALMRHFWVAWTFGLVSIQLNAHVTRRKKARPIHRCYLMG